MALTIVTSKANHRAGTQWVDGDTVNPVVEATAGATGTVNWSDGGAGGYFQVLSATEAIYVPANKTQAVTITGTDTGAGGSGNVAIQVVGTYPIQPSRGFDTQLDQETKTRRARGGTRYFREDYDEEVALSLAHERRSKAEMEALWDFWQAHRKVTPFYYLDVTTGLLNLVRFESAVIRRFDGACWWTLTCSVRGDFQNTLEPEGAPTSIRIAAGSTEYRNDYAPDAFYLNGDRWSLGNIAIDNSGITAPIPPDELFRWLRYHPTQVQYKFTGLKASQNYACRLFFMTQGAARTVSVQANGVTQGADLVLLNNDDAVEKSFTVASNGLGELAIDITRVSGPNAIVSGFEILEV